MKICPKCGKAYTDESLFFCLQDGAELEPFDNQTDETETVILKRVPEPPTVEKRSTDTSPPQSVVTRDVGAKSKLPTVLITAVATVFLMATAGALLGAGLWYFADRGEITAGSGDNSVTENRDAIENGADTDNADSGVTPKNTGKQKFENGTSPSPDIEKSPSPSPTAEAASPSPKPTVDPGVVRQAVRETIDTWKNLAESRNLGRYMSQYGDRIDYYRKKGASKAFVAKDKRRAFTNYSTIQIRLGPLTTSVSDDGNRATSTFDKEWLFANANESQTGKVRTELVLAWSGDKWRIVSERDLKVYYVNK